jgi:hypothetical protein
MKYRYRSTSGMWLVMTIRKGKVIDRVECVYKETANNQVKKFLDTNKFDYVEVFRTVGIWERVKPGGAA